MILIPQLVLQMFHEQHNYKFIITNDSARTTYDICYFELMILYGDIVQNKCNVEEKEG